MINSNFKIVFFLWKKINFVIDLQIENVNKGKNAKTATCPADSPLV